MKRTQIYLDEDQDRRLGERARSLRRTKSDLIRSAIGDYLSRPASVDEQLAEFRAAAEAAFGSARHLPADYVERLRDDDRRRSDELERRWHGEQA